MRLKVLIFTFITIFSLSFIVGCKKSGGSSSYRADGGGGGATPSSIRLIDGTPNYIQLSVASGGLSSFQIKASVNPSNAPQGVNYKVTSGTEVISVTKDGLVTALKTGAARITVSSIHNPNIKTDIQVDVNNSNVSANTLNGDVEWQLPAALPITGEQITFTEGTKKYNDVLPSPKDDEKVKPDNPVSLIGHYRIAYISVFDEQNKTVIDKIVGTGDNMRGEFAVNAENCFDTQRCPLGLQIRMQYKLQFSNSIIGIPENFKYIRHDILKSLGSLEIDKEFAKLGANVIEDDENKGEYVVEFTLKHTDIPMPKGYTAKIILKKIAHDKLLQTNINLDGKEYFSDDTSVKSVSIITPSLTLVKGTTGKLDYEVLPINAVNKDVVFTSENPEVLKVINDATGELEAVSKGEAKVTVTTKEGGFTSDIKVNVVNEFIPLKSFSSELGNFNSQLRLKQGTNTNESTFYFTPNDATDKSLHIVDISDPNAVLAEIREKEDGSPVLYVEGLSMPEQGDIVTVTIASDSNNELPAQSVKFQLIDNRSYPTGVSISNKGASNELNNLPPQVYYIYKDGGYNKDDSLGLSDGKFKIKASVTGNEVDTQFKIIEYETSNGNVATVDSNGVVTLHQPGEVTIISKPVFYSSCSSHPEKKAPDGSPYKLCYSYYPIIVYNEYKALEKLACVDTPTLTIYSSDKQKLNIGFTPNDASEQGIKFELIGDAEGLVALDNNGYVNYTGTTYSNESEQGAKDFVDKKATVRVTSTSDPKVSIDCDIDVSKVYVKPEEVSITNYDEVNNKELKAGDYYQGRVQIKATVLPSEASNKSLTYTIQSGDGVINVDGNGNVNAVKAGTAVVRVASQADPNKYKDVTFVVWEKLDLTGTYKIDSMTITYNNKTIESTGQTRMRTDQTNFSIFTQPNQIKVSSKFQLNWKGFVDDPFWDVFRFKYLNMVDNSSMDERSMNADTYKSKNIVINSDGSITFTFPFNVNGDELVYASGSQNKIVFKVSGRAGSFTSANGNRFTESTPVNFADPFTLQGTYDIVHFTQSNSMGTATCGTLASYGGVERMLGELTISISGTNRARTASMISKIQMNSSVLNGSGTIAGQCVACGQYAYTRFNNATVSPGVAQFGSHGSRESGIVKFNNGYLEISQQFSQSIAQVYVDTWMRKKSDKVATLTEKECYFGYNNGGGKSNAHNNGYCTPPAKEPDYSLGIIK